MTSQKKITVGALLVVVLAGIAFWWHGAHQSAKDALAISAAHPVAPTSAAMNVMPTQKVDSVDVMTERLRARLEKEPNDVNGWVLLGRSYHYLERWDDAKAAFAKARALGYQGDTETDTKAESKTTEAAGDSATAATAATSDSSDAVFADIGHVAQNREGDSSVSNSDASATAANFARVRVAVDVAPELRAKFAPATTVFIFARAAQGPRMPLAVVRKTLSELPAEIDLDDSLAMMPEAKISTAATIVLGARIAPSGNPIAQPEDVDVLSTPLSSWRGQRVSLLLKSK